MVLTKDDLSIDEEHLASQGWTVVSLQPSDKVEVPFCLPTSPELHSTHDESVENVRTLAYGCEGDLSNAHDQLEWEKWLCRVCTENDALEPSEIDRALNALDKMRRLNLEMELQLARNPEMSSERRLELLTTKCCTKCLLTAVPGSPCPTTNEVMMHVTSVFLKPCFTCGCPCCPAHQAKPSHRLHSFPMCSDCERLFTLDFVQDVLTAPVSQRYILIGQLLAVYDRSWLKFHQLRLTKSELIARLQEAQIQRNHIHVGKSSVGMVSGALGVAAAATSVAVPMVGTPLLVASLILGGGAAAVQTGTSVHHHMMFRPQQQAMQLLASHTVLKSVLRVVGTLRDAIVRDRLQQVQMSWLSGENPDALGENRSSNPPGSSVVADGCTVGRCSLVGVEVAVASRAATSVAGGEAAAGTAVADVLQSSTAITRLAGGALAAATLLLEAHSLASHVYDISQGSPCSMVEHLRGLGGLFPTAARVNAECQSYLNRLSQRERCMTESEVQSILLQLLSPPTISDQELELSELAGTVPRNGATSLSEVEMSPAASRSHARPASEERKQMTVRSNLQHLRQRIEVYTRQRPPSVASLTTTDDSDVSASSFDCEEDDSDSTSTSSSHLSLRARIERHKRRQRQPPKHTTP